jgi:hypothetical protein
MKRFAIILTLLICSFHAEADQYQIVSEEDAIVAVELLNGQTDVISWCDCCGPYDENFKYIQVQSASYDFASENGNDCYVFLYGYDEFGEWFEEAIDLAYIFIADGDWAVRLSDYIGLEASPCSEPFGYYDYYPFTIDEPSAYEDEYVTDEDYYYEDDAYEFESYEDVVTLRYLSCGDYCWIGFIDSEGIEDEVLIDYSIIPDEIWNANNEGDNLLNPAYDYSSAYIQVDPFEIEYEDGTYETTRMITAFEIIE